MSRSASVIVCPARMVRRRKLHVTLKCSVRACVYVCVGGGGVCALVCVRSQACVFTGVKNLPESAGSRK